MKYIFSISLFVGFIFLTYGQKNNSIKLLKKTYHYTYPICNEHESKNCFGYGYSDGPGPAGEIRGLCVLDSILYIVDSYKSIVSKVNLTNGEIIKHSNPFTSEAISTLDEILLFENKLLVLSNSSGYLYLIDTDLNIKKSFKIPFQGYFAKFLYVEKFLYILSSQSTLIKGSVEDHIVYKVGSGFDFKLDTIRMDSKKHWDSIFVYGKSVTMYEQSNKCYFKTSDIDYEIPELLPQFDYYTHSVGFNNHYFVYIVRNETFYELVVCEY